MAMETGTSMPSTRVRRSRSALRKKGSAEKNTTGVARAKESQWNSALKSALISPGPAT